MSVHNAINVKSNLGNGFSIRVSLQVRTQFATYGETWQKQALQNDLFTTPKHS